MNGAVLATPGVAVARPVLRALRSVSAVGIVVLSTWLLAVPLSHALPAPPLTAPAQWTGWLRANSAATVVFSLLRLGGVGVGAWLSFSVAVVALGSGWRRARIVMRVVPGPLLAAASVMIGASLTGCARGSSPTAGSSARQTGGPPPTVTIAALPTSPAPPPTVTLPARPARPAPPSGPPPAPVGAPPPPAPVGASPPPTPVGTPAPPGLPHPAPPPPSVAQSRVWTVAPGQSLWSIAASVVARAGGDPADLRQVGPYWERLLRVNPRPNPDLIRPGEVLSLPAFEPYRE